TPASSSRGRHCCPRPSPEWRSGARSCSPGCCATLKARWNSSSSPPTAWWSLVARSKSDRRKMVGQPLIVTATFGAADQAWLEDLRRAHYPQERNQVPAHLTLFRQLPPSVEPELAR